MSVELGDVIRAFHACGVDDCHAAFLISTIGDIHSFFCRVVPHVVGIFSDIARVQQFETVSVVNPELSVCPVGDEESLLSSPRYTTPCGVALAVRQRR